MADIVKQILARPIQLADQATKAADEVCNFKADCMEIKAKTEKLAALLRQAARASNDLYERPTRRIIDDTEQVLDKALTLVIKCCARGLSRVFTIIPTAALKKTAQQLENSCGDVQWLLRVSTPADDRDDEYLGLPPIAANEPILCLIWEQIAILCTGSLEERSDAAASLVSLARDNERYGKLIIEEGGVAPLLKLAKEGRKEGQENAARAIGLLGRDPESVEQIVNAGVCSVFAKILKDGHMKIQVVVAWAISELAANHHKCQDHFAQANTIRLLVSRLAFETIQEHSKYAIATKQQNMLIHTAAAMAQSNTSSTSKFSDYGGKVDDNDNRTHSKIPHPVDKQPANQMHNLVESAMAMKTQVQNQATNPIAGQNQQQHRQNPNQQKNHHVGLTGTSIKGREFEDPATKAEMKAMAARALRHLSAGNVSICSNITESRALLCFAVLLEKGPEEVQYHSAMALMEITGVAEQNSDLRRSAFKPTAPAAKAVVDQFLRIINQGDSELLCPSIKSIGHLARTFRATETRMIRPLVALLDDREPDVTREAAIALNKFASSDNFLRVDHCKAIIQAGGTKHLVPQVYFGEQMVQVPCLILLSYIAMHVPDSEALADDNAHIVLEWATKQAHLMQDPIVEELVNKGRESMELYQSRGSRL
ncbi:hypothetical protein P3S68_009254 [Capsicum galapagoense]